MTASTSLGPFVGVWLGLFIMFIYTWTWTLDCYLATSGWLLLGIPLFLAIRNIWKEK